MLPVRANGEPGNTMAAKQARYLNLVWIYNRLRRKKYESCLYVQDCAPRAAIRRPLRSLKQVDRTKCIKQTEGRGRSRFGAMSDLQKLRDKWRRNPYAGPSRNVVRRRSKFKNKCRECLLYTSSSINSSTIVRTIRRTRTYITSLYTGRKKLDAFVMCAEETSSKTKKCRDMSIYA